MSRHQPGRVRRRLTELLREAGFELEPEDIAEARGYWRQRRQENYLWDAHVRHRDHILPVEISSFCTMTECVRYGFEISWRKPYWAEIHSRAPPK